ncbi:hypothetical protein KM043_015874 [Ampulex compressa]|nr:hypothetical protein KM043_015874 [Ampulex compressa]
MNYIYFYKHYKINKVDGNIDKVFTKFINDGKATIRMIEPPHDIIIQCDAIQLKSFIHILKLGISKKVDPAVLGISNLNSKNISSLAKTKIVIKKNSEYPILEGFPKTTEELSLTGLGRKSFDRQILRLQNLKVLNLSENQLSSLPKELGNLPHLQELVIAQNQLGKGTISKWLWLDQVAIKSNLRLLDISDNLLQELPKQIGKLDALVTLKVRQNMLRSLPQSIGNLPSLRYLDLSKNLLTHVTGSMKNLKLLELDISENAFSNFEPYSMCKIDVPTLIECAARGFLKTRRSYNGSIIPETLVKFLDQAKYCVCGNACFHCYIRKFMECNLSVVANSIKSSGNGIVPFDCYFCSINCLRRYAKVQY